jgi:beta-glucosidase-like glycosyl hydrolase
VSASLARLVFPSLRFKPATGGGFAHERAKIDAALKAGVGGFILFGGDRASIATLTTNLRTAGGRPLLIGADLERGPRQQVEGLTELPPPAALGWLADLEATNTAGVITAGEARSVGITWAFAPVCDLDNEPKNPIVQTRSFGVDPALVGEHAAAWIRGCQEHGVLACAKHYPGHGRTTQDSHATLPRVTTAMAELEQTDLVPFAAAVRAGVGSVMSAFVAYPGWDPTGSAAGYSPVMLDYLRATFGFDGIVVTDALIMAGATARQAEAPATASAVAAGCDALLYPADFASVVAELDRAVGGVIPVARADAALARYQHAVDTWSQGPDQGEPGLAAHAGYADGLATRVTHMVRGTPSAIVAPLSVSIVDDDLGGPYKVGPRDVFHHTLREAGVGITRATGNVQRATGIVLVYAEPRSWKGRADLGPRSLSALKRLAPNAALIILFGHPRLVAQIPGKAPVVCCWHGQPLMQRAAARWVIERTK